MAKAAWQMSASETPSHGLPPVWLLISLQAVVSAASLVVEIVAGRMLAPYLGMSIYTWTSVIAVVLAGFSAGHWAGGIIAGQDPARSLRLNGWAMVCAALFTASALFILRWAAGLILPRTDNPLMAIILITSLVFFIPSFMAGIPAPILARIAVLKDQRGAGRALGGIFAAGAFGAIAGTLAAGFVFISWLGTTGTLAAVTLAYLACAAASFVSSGRIDTRLLPLILLALLVPAAAALAAIRAPAVCQVESRYFCIRTVDASFEQGAAARLMVLDHLAHGISFRDTPQRMGTPHAALLDLLARQRMEGRVFSAFFIGGGSYSIPRAWEENGDVSSMTVAEIDPSVTAIARDQFWFEPVKTSVIDGDARLALRTGETRYDVIIGDAFTDIAVPQHLVTREFFQLVRSRLKDDGIYLMNIVDHAGRLNALSAVVRTLQETFPTVEVWTERENTGDRIVFVVLAGQAASSFTTVSEADFGFGNPPRNFSRIKAESVSSLIAKLDPPLLTDNYAPVDRLMGPLD
jgi:spermidine synthase